MEPLKILNGIVLILDDQGNHLDSIIYNQLGIIQVLQRSPILEISNWSGTFFCYFLQQTGSSVRWWIVTVFVTWERSQRKIRKFLLPILTNRWSALASIGLYRKPQKQRGSMGTECCFCCIFLNAKPMMNWHLPQLQRNYFWAKSCRAFVQLWHWILVTTAMVGTNVQLWCIVMEKS